MTSRELTIALIFAASGIVIGFLIAVLGMRRKVRSPAVPIVVNEQNQKSPAEHDEIQRRINSLCELTSLVGTQVSQHTQCVSKITGSIEGEQNAQTNVILLAGKMLLTANKCLQADLEKAHEEIQLQRDQLSSYMQESLTDSLTRLSNRRAFDQELKRVVAHHHRTETTFSLILIDVDHFKQVNDRYGHLIGDQLLKSIARSLANSVSQTEFVARFGGEEFVVILPETPIEDACQTAERIRHHVSQHPHKVGTFELMVTISVGITEIANGEREKDLFEKADEALYTAKTAGRNCCYYHDGATTQRSLHVTTCSENDTESCTRLSV